MKPKLLFILVGVLAVMAFLLVQPLYAEFFAQTPQGAVCPLSDSQQERAQQAFAEIYRMITSDPPRCINCHGKVQPFANNTTHEGGKMNPVFKKGKLLVFIDSQGEAIKDATQTFASQCILCHEVPFFPPRPVAFWVGRTPIQLCQQFKKRFNNDASRFLDHIRDDELAAVGFTGTRGLNDVGQLLAINLPYKPEPPSFTKQDLHLYTTIWIDAHGGKFRGGESCGCEPHHYAFQINLDEGVKPQGMQGVFKGHANFKVPIKFNEDGSFSGESKVNIPVSGTLTGPDFTCTVTVKIENESWKLSGKDDDQDTMHITVNIEGPPWTTHSLCKTSEGQVIAGNYTTTPAKFSFQFDMPAIVGETKSGLDWSNPQGGFDNVKITIVEHGP